MNLNVSGNWAFYMHGFGFLISGFGFRKKANGN